MFTLNCENEVGIIQIFCYVLGNFFVILLQIFSTQEQVHSK